VPNGPETRCNAPLWQGRSDGLRKPRFQSKSPGNRPGLSPNTTPLDQAAGL
jgi:hypothetical protein